ncbi:TIR domain-containing protein [Sphingomicrobium nitratireducens]|uniref:TIR domain-containing protein n=1 Tax=Sphingomicrobium nitratireducens TaxID=2964666 RepID=UPI002240B35C|nr:TIR domain-containing protein [Sphingomicrobium nitratireducens]
MADIFLSYARPDQPVVEELAAALEQAGFSVWWDRQLTGGHDFSDDIEHEIEAAQTVLVAWSEHSVKSHWVRDEAAFGRDHHKLLPIQIDDSLPPMGYRQLHTIDYREGNRGAGLAALVSAVSMRLDRDEPPSPPPAPVPVAPAKRLSKKWLAGIAAALLLVLAGVAAFQGGYIPGAQSEQAQSLSLAVTPFTSPGDEDLSTVGERMAATVASRLSDLPGLTLASTNSVNAAVRAGATARKLGTDMGVTHVLEGQLLPVGDDMLQLDLALIDAASGKRVWTKTIEERRALPEELAQQSAQAAGIALQIRQGVGFGGSPLPADIPAKARDPYLSGMARLAERSDLESRAAAYRDFVRAAELAPDFAPAHAGAAYILSLSDSDTFGFDDERRKSAFHEHLDRALELDPDNIMARAAASQGAARIDYDFAKSVEIGEALLADAPDDGLVNYKMFQIAQVRGDLASSRAYIERAVARDPLNPLLRTARANVLMETGNLELLGAVIRECDMCRTNNQFRLISILAHGSQDNIDRSWDKLDTYFRRDGTPPEILAQARSALEAYVANRKQPLPPFMDRQNNANKVVFQSRLVGIDAALDTLAEVVEANPDELTMLLTDMRTAFPPEARADPRYHKILEDPWIAMLVNARRENGVMGGLPLAPEEVEAEKARLAKLRR